MLRNPAKTYGGSRPVTRPSDTSWKGRYDRAYTALNSGAAMVPLYRLAAEVTEDEEPRVLSVSGQDALARARRVGLLPGSFNPLTSAHIALAEAARRAANLDAVVWSVAARTIDKESVTRATVPDRLAQLAAYVLLEQMDAVVLLNRGLYVEQVRVLRTLAGGTMVPAIVVGFDKVVQIFDARYYADRKGALDDLFSHATLLVAPRLSDDELSLEELLSRPENLRYAPYIRYVNVPSSYRTQSSTEARHMLMSADRGTEDVAELEAAAPLIPPEGYALARLMPYATVSDPRSDMYGMRVQWLEALSQLEGEQLAALPPLDRLVAMAMAEDETGDALRRWLDAATQGSASLNLDGVLQILKRR